MPFSSSTKTKNTSDFDTQSIASSNSATSTDHLIRTKESAQKNFAASQASQASQEQKPSTRKAHGSTVSSAAVYLSLK